MRSIAVVSCFFGKWPEWIDFFLASCRHNASVDFLLVTDCGPPRQALAANTKLVAMDLPSLRALASERLGLPVALNRAYKVIDFRPAWGVVFENLLAPYDFWGYCDLDLVFGDIRSFLGEEVLSAYDVISTRREFLTGPFTLFRNAPEINRLYERSRDYRRVFTSDTIFNFEECGWGLHYKLLAGAPFAAVAAEAQVDTLMHVLARSPEIRVRYETVGGEWLSPRLIPGSRMHKILWDRGRVFDVDDGIELMYFHLMYLKHQRRLFIPRWKELPEVYSIRRRGFYWRSQEWPRRLATAARRELYFAGRSLWAAYRRAGELFWSVVDRNSRAKSFGPR
jgi:hypothetical protein